MWKIVAVILWAWIPFCGQPLRGQAPRVRVESRGHKNDIAKKAAPDTQTDQRGTGDAPLVVDIKDHHKSEQETADIKREKDDKNFYDRWAFRLAAIGTGVNVLLLCVGACGVIFALRTLRYIKKQTKATRDSVDVLINSERAWVVVNKVRPPDIGPPLGGRINAFVFDLENRGRTVARMTGPYRMKFHLIGRDDKLPDVPNYDISPEALCSSLRGQATYGIVLAPSEAYGEVSVHNLDVQITIGLFESIQKMEAVLYFYASLRYFDFAEIERDLQFCYRYFPKDETPGIQLPARWERFGPTGYNKHT